MPDDLDLEHGRPEDDVAARRRRRREQRDGSAAAKAKPTAGTVTDNEVRSQLSRAFDGLAKARDARGDEELAEAIREETEPMAEGFVTLTHSITPLRMPLIIILNIAITLLAFGRVGGILTRRFVERRQRRAAERATAAGAVDELFTEQ